MAFVHLHNHTEYSLLDGLTHIKDMVRRAAELDMPAVAVTDHGVMSGMVELSDACDAVEKETGKRVKPIFGCEVYFTPDESLRKDVKPKLYHLLLLAKNNEGYHNLLKLVSESHVDNFYYKPRTTFSMLQKYGHGIIGSSACIAGVIPKLLDERRFDDAVEWARKFASCFDEGDFYIELQNQGIRTDAGFTQTELNHELTRVAKAAGLKTIATNDFHYLLKEDAEAQDIMLCIGTGSTVNQTNRMKDVYKRQCESTSPRRGALISGTETAYSRYRLLLIAGTKPGDRWYRERLLLKFFQWMRDTHGLDYGEIEF